jgi:hypothetical protein
MVRCYVLYAAHCPQSKQLTALAAQTRYATEEGYSEWSQVPVNISPNGRQSVKVPGQSGHGNIHVALARLVAFVCDLPGLQHLMEINGGCILTLFQVDHKNGECLRLAHMPRPYESYCA